MQIPFSSRPLTVPEDTPPAENGHYHAGNDRAHAQSKSAGPHFEAHEAGNEGSTPYTSGRNRDGNEQRQSDESPAAKVNTALVTARKERVNICSHRGPATDSPANRLEDQKQGRHRYQVADQCQSKCFPGRYTEGYAQGYGTPQLNHGQHGHPHNQQFSTQES